MTHWYVNIHWFNHLTTIRFYPPHFLIFNIVQAQLTICNHTALCRNDIYMISYPQIEISFGGGIGSFILFLDQWKQNQNIFSTFCNKKYQLQSNFIIHFGQSIFFYVSVYWICILINWLTDINSASDTKWLTDKNWWTITNSNVHCWCYE